MKSVLNSKNIILLVMPLVYFCLLTFLTDFFTNDYLNKQLGISFSSLILFSSCVFLFGKFSLKTNLTLNKVILAVIFSIFTIAGKLTALQLSGRQIENIKSVTLILCFAGLVVIYTIAISWIYRAADTNAVNFSSNKDQLSIKKFSWSKYKLFASSLIIFVCWLPFLISTYPGTLSHDSFSMLNQGVGIWKLSNHHPWMLSVVWGWLFKFINLFFEDNKSLFILTSFSCWLNAFFYSIGFYYLSKTIASRLEKVIFFISFLYICFFPIIVLYSITLIKDSIFAGVYCAYFCLFCYLLIEIKNNICNYKSFFVLFLLSLILIISRHNGIYISLFSFAFLVGFALLNRSNKHFSKKPIYFFVLLILLIISFNLINKSVLMPRLNVIPASVKEVLSLPLQQIASVAFFEKQNLDANSINKINSILDFKEISKNYHPEISDYVKATYKHKKLSNLITIWVELGNKYPWRYLESFASQTFGYIYPFSLRKVLGTYQLYIKGPPVNTGRYDFKAKFPNQIASLLISADEASKLPIIGFLFNPASLTWITLLAFFYLVERRSYYFALGLSIIPAVTICMNILSPVNGFVRYTLPLFSIFPFFIYFTIYVVNLNKCNSLTNINKC